MRDASGALELLELPRPKDEELAAILRRVVVRTEAMVASRGLLARESDGPLAELQAEAVQGVLPLGQALAFWPRAPRKGVAELDGYSLEANAQVHANDRQGLEHLCRYLLRPPFALSRLRDAGDGRIILTLKRPRRDGTTELAFTPRELLRRLAAQVAPPRAHLVRFHGVFGPAAKDRSKVVPRSPPRVVKCQELRAPPKVPTVAERYSDELEKDPHSPRRLDWASLLKRTWDLDVLQCPCGGRRRVMAFVTDKDEARKILQRLGLPATGPPLAPARPPKWQAELDLQPPEEFGSDPTYPDDGAQQPAFDEV